MTEESVPSDDLVSFADQKGEEPPSTRWRWWVHLLVIGVYPLLGIVVRSTHTVRGPALSNTPRGLLMVSGLEIILFSVVFTLGWLASRASSEELLLYWRPGWWVAPLGIIYSVAIRLALGLIVMVGAILLVITRVFTPQTLQGFVDTNRPKVEALVSVSALEHSPSYFWLTVTLVSFVVAGLREELWRAATLAAFRKLWPGGFASRNGQYFAVALIAVVFGAMHITMGPIAAVLAAVLGLFLGIIMIFHRSIWPAVIAHGLFDATTFAILPWALEKLQNFP